MCKLKLLGILNGKIWAIFAAPDSKMTMFRKCEPQSFRN